MSCPNWTRLAAHRADLQLPEPGGWQDALAHLDGCEVCRRQAVAADPTLVFRRLADTYRASDAADASDVAEMRRAVAAMRRASRIVPAYRAPTRLRRGGRRLAEGGRGWWRAAAAVVLATGLLTLAPGSHRPDGATAPPSTTAATATDARAALALTSQPLPATTADAPARLPVFEGLERPRNATVYQLVGEGMVVVMIVDETLDV